MEIKDRIKLLRKDLHLSQADFSSRLGISQSQMACYENGLRAITDRTILAICKEYNVNKKWITEGIGDMYTISKSNSNLMKTLANITISDDERLKEVVSNLMKLNDEYIDCIGKLVDGLLK